MIVLDASALTALLLREPGADAVAESISQAAISAVNIAEVLARMTRERIAARDLVPRLEALGLAIIAFDLDQAMIVSELREPARAQGIGLADCCCMALALHRSWPVMTADRIWTRLGFGLDVRLIR